MLRMVKLSRLPTQSSPMQCMRACVSACVRACVADGVGALRAGAWRRGASVRHHVRQLAVLPSAPTAPIAPTAKNNFGEIH